MEMTRGEKIKATMISKYGVDGYKKIMSNNGRIGGKKGTGHQFAHGKVSPKDAGSIGGKKRIENIRARTTTQ